MTPIDGTNGWSRFRHITLPLMKRTLLFVVVADTVSNFLMFAPSYMLTNGGPEGSTDFVMFEMFKNAYTYSNVNTASAMVVVVLDIFTEFNYGIAVVNSLFVAAATIAFGIIFNGMAGFAFAKFEFKGKNLLFIIVMVTFMIPFELMSINLYKLMIDINWINTYWALIIPSISNGMVIFMFRQYFLGFPNYMIESAMIDGISWPRIFWSIAMPNSKSICISAGLILFLTQWESFLWPVLITRTPQMSTIQIALSSFQTEHAKLWNDIFAASIIAFIIPILVILPLQKYFVEGITSTGTKE